MHGRYLAAVLACGPGAALSHRSAADLWGLRRGSFQIEVTVTRGRVGQRGIKVHRSRILAEDDVATLDHISVTTVARTLLDLAGVIPARDLERAVDRAERLDLFDLAAVERVLSRAGGRGGVATLRRCIAAWRPSHTRSELEDRHRELVLAAGLPAPQLNVLLDGEERTHEVDAFWPSHRLVVQLDGFEYHRTRRDRERDSATDADLALAGYRVLRLTWDDVIVHQRRTGRRLQSLLTQPGFPVES
jgi:hypothetical protein